MFEDDWAFPIVDGKNGDAGLVYSTMAFVERRVSKHSLCSVSYLFEGRGCSEMVAQFDVPEDTMMYIQ
jgi:hypothetical protein